MMSLRLVRSNRLIPSPAVPVLENQDLQSDAIWLYCTFSIILRMHELVAEPHDN